MSGIIDHGNKVSFDEFSSTLEKEKFPMEIEKFKKILSKLSTGIYIWYTYTFNPFYLVQCPYFIDQCIPSNARLVYRVENNYMRILPNIFSHPLVFRISTSSEGICIFAIDDEV